ncbi:unnamed protein product [Angiostrongylus costaricensis]|uniref:UPAR/Ly6 domain-containing protein n=1 Tax=Angiostrongylus costaricensis TaxID=334426 RepID=A0A158PDB0_ANGCS|nr:unnamed protein product [Angiostrongylus costaricensis]
MRVLCFTCLSAISIDLCHSNHPCVDSTDDNFFSYNACCENECCNRLRFWVIPACIATVGFVSGAFFALCFQCR